MPSFEDYGMGISMKNTFYTAICITGNLEE